jgi:AraC-like DNA-binding protein
MSEARSRRVAAHARANSGSPRSSASADELVENFDDGQRLVELVMRVLARNFGKPLTLQDIGDASGYSVYQIIRVFRRRLGTTPHAYLMRVRLEYAAERLSQGDTIAGAAADAGFSDQSHLTRHFKRVFGMTPRNYVLAGKRMAAAISLASKGYTVHSGQAALQPQRACSESVELL